MKKLLRTILFFLVRLFGVLAQQGSRPASTHPRILLVCSGQLGDLVLITPVLHALKTAAPNASITLLVAPGSHDVVARHPDVDQVLMCRLPSYQAASAQAFTSWYVLWCTARQLRLGHYDLAINLRAHFWWGAALLCLAGIPRRNGYATARSTLLLTHTIPLQQEHVTVSFLRLVSAGLRTLEYPPLEEPFTPERYPLYVRLKAQEQHWVAERLRAEGIEPAMPIVVLHPGSGAALKMWRAEAWAHCITALVSSWSCPPTVHFILTGSPSERPLLEAIARDTSTHTTLVTDATIGQLAALLQRAQLVLGVDSGPLHLAIAQGTPTIQIFGPTDPARYGPWARADRHAVVASSHQCAACSAIPCGKLVVPLRELVAHPCVRLVSEHLVLTAAFETCPDLVKRGAGERV